MHEELLLGGNTHAAIVRIGDTVRRPTGAWTPGVHALLQHLERRSYDGAPRLLGLDDQGREVLEFVPGSVIWPDHFALVQTDSALFEVAATIRRYHHAAADFDFGAFAWSGPRKRHAWAERDHLPQRPRVPGTSFTSHRDDGGSSTGTSRRRVGWLGISLLALLSFVQLMPDSRLTEAETCHRIAVFGAGYGEPLPTDILAVAVERCATEAARIEQDGRAGIEPYARLLAEGHATIWREAEAHIESNRARWQPALTQ